MPSARDRAPNRCRKSSFPNVDRQVQARQGVPRRLFKALFSRLGRGCRKRRPIEHERQTDACPYLQGLALSKHYISRLWRQRPFQESVKPGKSLQPSRLDSSFARTKVLGTAEMESDLPDTIHSRAIIIKMRPAHSGRKCPRYRCNPCYF